MKESFKQAGYRYERYLNHGEHLLYNKRTRQFEIFASNKNHASWGLTFKNTHLEYCRDFN